MNSLKGMDRPQKHVADLLSGLTVSSTPVLIIKYGPPASGKGSCLNVFYETARKMGFNSDDFLDANIDDVITLLDVEKSILKDPQNYHSFRPEAGKIVEEAIQIALTNHYNIVMETTGGTVDKQWYIDLISKAKQNKYKVLIVYPLVPKETLVSRSEKRALQIGRRPEPNLIRTVSELAAKNISKLYKMLDRDDKLIVYDNRHGIPCSPYIFECDGETCTANIEWTIQTAVKELFDVDIAIGGAEHWSVRFAKTALIVVIVVVIILIVLHLWRRRTTAVSRFVHAHRRTAKASNPSIHRRISR